MSKIDPKYRKYFKPEHFLSFVSESIKKLGIQLSYACLLLFYALKDGKVPAWAKRVIIGVLGYVVAPIDAVPDITPFVGFTDDLGLAMFGLVTIACYINDDIRSKAKSTITHWYNEVDVAALESVDARL